MIKQMSAKELSYMGNRSSFNRTLRHIVSVTSMVEAVSKGANLADIMFEMIQAGSMEREQVSPVVSAICLNKFDMPFVAWNVEQHITDFSAIQSTAQEWNALQFIMVYHQPNVGTVPINPANPEHWEAVHDLKQHELLVVYCHHTKNKSDIAKQGCAAMLSLLRQESPQVAPDFKAATPTAAPAAAPKKTGGKRNLTPKYSVQVTNELFHNGNVEAWKNIIESYEDRNTDCDVLVYHEGELIQDLNSLFKWGKVKHGGLIFFQISGLNIKGVSRLQKYLHEGASPRFEAFLKHDVNKVLNLF
ncbi:MAG: hypothetical protein KDK39_00815 [Leptospiraceae bacterium]|nr:hypothetical protein [Leptospiraceae bacterium]